MRKCDVLILGAGPAGMTAAIYARRSGADVIILDPEPMPGGQMTTTPEIENMPGFSKIDGFSLSEKMAEQAKNLGAEFINLRCENLMLEPNNLTAQTKDEPIFARSIILTMGCRRRKLDVPGEERLAGRGVSYCAVCDGNFFKNKPVAVIGGGNTALEDALHLADLGCEVSLLHRRDEFRGTPVLVERVKNSQSIEIRTPYKLKTINGESHVTGLIAEHVTAHTELQLDIKAVFACVGTLANTELVRGLIPLDNEGRIIAGEDCKTNIPGVFAAGDIRAKPLYQIVTAAADGAVAAQAAVLWG